MGKTSLLILMVLAVAVGGAAGCDEPRRSAEPAKTQPAAPARAEPGPAPVQVRVSISLDDQEMKFVIPETQPALVGKSRWEKKLALLAEERTPTKIMLRVGIVPASVEAADVDIATLSSQAPFSQYLEKGQSVTLSPGATIPSDGLGDPPPREIRVTWLP